MKRNQKNITQAAETPAAEPVEVNEFTFDQATRDMLAEITEGEVAAVNAAAKPFREMRSTVMLHALRLAGLNTGQWDPKADGSGMVRAGAPAAPIPLKPEILNPTRRSKRRP